MTSPWVNYNFASSRVNLAFEKLEKSKINKCVDCGCGIVAMTDKGKTIFGYKIELKKLCGFVDADEKPQTDDVFISFLGTVHGLDFT